MALTGTEHLAKAPEDAARWQWTNLRVAMLVLWAFLLGANCVRLIGAVDAHERWLGAALGIFVSAGSIAYFLFMARRPPERHGVTAQESPTALRRSPPHRVSRRRE